MKRNLAVGIILPAVIILSAGTFAFSQTSAKSTDITYTSKGLPAAADRQTASYIVKKGDTLYRIANANRVTVAALKSLNQMSTTRLQVGQRLSLPSPHPASATPARPSSRSDTSGVPAPTPGNGTGEATPLEESSTATWLTAGTVPEDENTDAPGESAEQPLRYRLATAGLNFLGVRYRWNGNSESSGFDCSGMVKSLFEKFNISLPRSSREQYKVGEKIDKDKLEVGDLVFFSSRGNTPTHVGIYLGDNMFLHAARKARKVLVSNLTAVWYSKRFLGARRLSDLWESEVKPAETKSGH